MLLGLPPQPGKLVPAKLWYLQHHLPPGLNIYQLHLVSHPSSLSFCVINGGCQFHAALDSKNKNVLLYASILIPRKAALCVCEAVNIHRKSCGFFPWEINFLIISHQQNISLYINVVKDLIRQIDTWGIKWKVAVETITWNKSFFCALKIPVFVFY